MIERVNINKASLKKCLEFNLVSALSLHMSYIFYVRDWKARSVEKYKHWLLTSCYFDIFNAIPYLSLVKKLKKPMPTIKINA